MYEPELSDFFDLDSCDRCGDCLAACPEFGPRLGDPARAMRALIGGVDLPEVVDRCSSCMSCSAACPRDCNPYGLILYRWFRRGRRESYPVRASLVMPLEENNAWHRVMGNLPADEAPLLARWADLERSELEGRALFAGCNLQILPYMADTPLFEGLPIFGRTDLCCGEVYYRMGAFDKVKSISDRLTALYSDFPAREVVCYCQACFNILSNVLPSFFGACFPFEISYYGDLLSEMVLSGQLGIEGKLSGLKVCVQDPCHAKLLGSEFRAGPRRVLEYMGCDVIEMKHTGEMSLCCGLGHGAARFNPLDMAGGIIRRLREARATKADRLAVYCNSCDLLFSVGTQVTPFIIPVWHLNELVCEAMGLETPRRNLARARAMVAELFVKGAPKILSRKRFFPPEMP